jgi:hypothetical protein
MTRLQDLAADFVKVCKEQFQDSLGIHVVERHFENSVMSRINTTQWAATKRQLHQQIESLQRREEHIQKKLAEKRTLLVFMQQFESQGLSGSQGSREPRIQLSSAIHESAQALGRFTKRELEHDIRERHPNFQLKFKSLESSLNQIVKRNALIVVKQGGGHPELGPSIYQIPSYSSAPAN